MPDQRYEAHRQTIGALLSTTSPRIEVPDWQRSYSWDTSQVDTFWQDLLAFDERYPEKNIGGSTGPEVEEGTEASLDQLPEVPTE
ncbi:hypothetical protein Acsp03_71380 [Actinomadura sp. NBRC 104412]|uniref:DUF262 domain-containing protein n=1 Tax=Actinomadura sp. NBRC 104412 TaxID=3032203 RepID=UPI0024A212F5|nr:DUF262 domain-containing protein [Actinomadura sp. NBRC 104412]GLZ09672.1 hypothetical protein Acsp03_71380 [Actinomadura sp. NBRC 104412]